MRETFQMAEEFLWVTVVGFNQIKFVGLPSCLDQMIKVLLELGQFSEFETGWIMIQGAAKGTRAVDFMVDCRSEPLGEWLCSRTNCGNVQHGGSYDHPFHE